MVMTDAPSAAGVDERIAEAERLVERDPERACELLAEVAALARDQSLDADVGWACELFARAVLVTGDVERTVEALRGAERAYAAESDEGGAARMAAALAAIGDGYGFDDDGHVMEEELEWVRDLIAYRRSGEGDAEDLVDQRARLDLLASLPLANGELPSLTRLARLFGLDLADRALLVAAAAPSLDEPIARSMREAQGDFSARAPSVWFLAELVAPSLASFSSTAELVDRLGDNAPLRTNDLVALHPHPDRPQGARRHALVDADPDVVGFMLGERALSQALRGEARLLSQPSDWVTAPPLLEERWLALRTALEAREPVARVVLVGSPGAGKKAVAARLAGQLGLRLLVLPLVELAADPARLGMLLRVASRDAILHEALVALDARDGLPGDADPLPLQHIVARFFEAHHRPVFVLGRHADAVAGLTRVGAIELRVPPYQFDVQVEHFVRSLTALGAEVPPAELLRAAGCQAGLTPGTIEDACCRAVARARLRSPEHPTPTSDELREAVRVQFSTTLSRIAQRIAAPFRWGDLILPPNVRTRLEDICHYLTHQGHVFDDWGFASKVPYGRGVSALFAGPPGTGKTMAAMVISAELGLDLYRIDLSQVVSKYVGETEKNLGLIFDRAAEGQAILLFDEADSLFARRTDVKSSIDRYSNLEVNYLLQRLEGFEGITILTTNFLKNIDEAFRRRLRFLIEFPFPSVEEREALWRSMIPSSARVRGDVPWLVLAQLELAGGNIKNAVMRAAFAAAARADEILPFDMVRAGVEELEAMGRLTPDVRRTLRALELPPGVAPPPPDEASGEAPVASDGRGKPSKATSAEPARTARYPNLPKPGNRRRILPNFPFPKKE